MYKIQCDEILELIS